MKATIARKVRLGVEQLGQREMPAVTPLADPMAGFMQGTFTTDTTKPEAGTIYALHGNLDSTALGSATVDGSIQTVGWAPFAAHGSLLITGAQGSVRLDVLGPTQPSYSDMPGSLTYKIISASTLYKSLVNRTGTFAININTGTGVWDGVVAANLTKGGGNGIFTQVSSPPDVGKQYLFQGNGSVGGLGSVAINGTVAGVGNIAVGQAVGSMTLDNGQYQLTISLLGPVQPGLATLPRSMTYTIGNSPGDGTQGTATFTARLDGTFNVTLTPNAPVYSLAPSAAVRYAAEVDSIYRLYLGHDAGAARTGWVAAMMNGTGIQNVAYSVLNSAEYVQAHGAGDAATYIQAVYNDVLGRAASTSELNSWVSAWSTLGQSRILRSIISSDEALTKTVDRLFVTYLGHSADANTTAAAVNGLKKGTITVDKLVVKILTSSEATNRLGLRVL